MGIITEDIKPTRNQTPVSTTEFVRTKPFQDSSSTITSAKELLTVTNKCVIHRNVVSGQKMVNIIPLRSIDSFSIQTYRLKSVLVLAVDLLLTVAALGVWIFLLPLAKDKLFHSATFVRPDFGLLWIPLVLLICGLISLVTYATYHQVELVIYTLSGNNQIEIALSSKIRNSVEAFVADIEAQMHKV